MNPINAWKALTGAIKKAIKLEAAERPAHNPEPVKPGHRRRSVQAAQTAKPAAKGPQKVPFERSKRYARETNWQSIITMRRPELETHVKTLQKRLSQQLKSMTDNQARLLYGGKRSANYEHVTGLLRRLKLPEDNSKARGMLLHTAAEIINILDTQAQSRAGYKAWENNVRNAIARATGTDPAKISAEDVHVIGSLIGEIQKANAENALAYASDQEVNMAYTLFNENKKMTLTQLKIKAAEISDRLKFEKAEKMRVAQNLTGISYFPSNGRG